MKKSSWLILVLLTLVAAGGWLAAAQATDKATDPVCGMSETKATAKWTYDFKGTTYYFCSEGCKTSFAKEPEKYLAQEAEKKPMMGGMMQGQAMQAHEGMMAGCPMMLPDVVRKVDVVKDGVVVTLTSKNAETVKKIQEHAAKMMEAKKDAAACPMAKSEGACASCPAKK
jgi:YHS domain-containing protein